LSYRALALASLLSTLACGPTASGLPDPEADAGTSDQPDGGGNVDPPPASMFVHTPDTLFTIDDESFELIEIGSFGLDASEPITDLAVTPDGNIYGITSDKLFAVDRGTGVATFIADVPGIENVGMTFLNDGTLLATDKAGGVRQIDPETGAVTEIGEFGNQFATAGDLVAVADGTMFAISDEGPNGNEQENNVLLTVDTSTGNAAAVGQIGYGRVFGCAIANNAVYAFTEDGDVIEIDPSTGSGQLVRSHEQLFWGAGVTPLVVVE
jgi:outer membrane protein assembly factor BamB